MLNTVSKSNVSEKPYVILTPAGVFEAFSYSQTDENKSALQALLSKKNTWTVTEWVETYSNALLEDFDDKGWVQFLSKSLPAPNIPLDKFLPYVMASLSGNRKAAIGSNEGFCLARTGFSQEEAETICVAGADFFGFLNRQQQRGWAIHEQAFSFFPHVDLLMPTTSFIFLKIDGEGYILVIEGEPLTNSRAFVELIWGIKTSGLRFVHEEEE